jgi:hypothetical protein
VSSRARPRPRPSSRGTVWVPESALDAYGRAAALDTQPGVPGERIAEGGPGPTCRPGFMRARTGASPSTRHRRHGAGPAAWPESVRVEGSTSRARCRSRAAPGAGAGASARGRAGLAAPVGAAARARRGAGGAPLRAAPGPPDRARAGGARARRSPPRPPRRARGVRPGRDRAGGARACADRATRRWTSWPRRGFWGLSNTLWRGRPSSPQPPMGVDIEADEIAFFPSSTGP